MKSILLVLLASFYFIGFIACNTSNSENSLDNIENEGTIKIDNKINTDENKIKESKQIGVRDTSPIQTTVKELDSNNINELNTDSLPKNSTNDSIIQNVETISKQVVTEPVEKQAVEADPDRNTFLKLDKEPIILNYDEVKALIGYPQVAKDAEIEGVVAVMIFVGKDGNFVKYRVIKVAHPILDNQVEAYVNKLKFEPATLDGNPVSYWMNVFFYFRL